MYPPVPGCVGFDWVVLSTTMPNTVAGAGELLFVTVKLLAPASIEATDTGPRFHPEGVMPVMVTMSLAEIPLGALVR
jgi:hypothetical protein